MPPPPPPPGGLAIPSGYVLGDQIYNTTDLSEWGTQLGDWQFLYNDDGNIPSPYTRYNSSPSQTDAEYFSPDQYSVGASGAILKCMPKPSDAPTGTSDLLCVSGVLTSFLPGSEGTTLLTGGVHLKVGGTGFLYGQALMQLPGFIGTWPAKWGHFLNGDIEMDVDEGGYTLDSAPNSTFAANWHVSGLSQSIINTGTDFTAGFNTFWFEWSASNYLHMGWAAGDGSGARTTIGSYTTDVPDNTDEFGVIFNVQAGNPDGLFFGGPAAYADGTGELVISQFQVFAK